MCEMITGVRWWQSACAIFPVWAWITISTVLMNLGSCCRLMGLPDEFDLIETVASVVGSTVCD